MVDPQLKDKINSRIGRLRRKGVDVLSYLNQELIAKMEKIESKEKELKTLAARLDEFERLMKERRLTVTEAYNKTSLQNRYWMLVKECSEELDLCKAYRSKLEYEMNPTRPRNRGKSKSKGG